MLAINCSASIESLNRFIVELSINDKNIKFTSIPFEDSYIRCTTTSVQEAMDWIIGLREAADTIERKLKLYSEPHNLPQGE